MAWRVIAFRETFFDSDEELRRELLELGVSDERIAAAIARGSATLRHGELNDRDFVQVTIGKVDGLVA